MTANMERWRAEQARESLNKAFQDQGRELGRLRDLIQAIYERAQLCSDAHDILTLIDEHDRDEKDHAQRIQATRDAYYGDLVPSQADPNWGW